MVTRLQRFDFGAMRDFRKPVPVVIADEMQATLPEASPPAPQFSEQELMTARSVARDEGYADGVATGLAQAAAAADAEQGRAMAAIKRLGEQLDQLQSRYADLIAHESQELSALVLMIARKVAGEALMANHARVIEALVAQCLPVFFSRPRLLIDLHPDALPVVSAQVTSLLQQRSFEGDVQFRGNAALDQADVMLDWGHGQARRSTAQLWQDIESLLQKMPPHLTSATPSIPNEPAAPDMQAILPVAEPLTPEPGA